REYRMGVPFAEADGVQFQCPLCAERLANARKATGNTEPGTAGEVGEEGGRRFVRGAHYVICWFRGKVPDDLNPKPGRWTPSGTGLDDLTFVPGTPALAVSVLLTSGCGWHSFVRDGEAA